MSEHAGLIIADPGREYATGIEDSRLALVAFTQDRRGAQHASFGKRQSTYQDR
jgi:hypothetical protein